MGLQEALRRAAGLIIEQSPDASAHAASGDDDLFAPEENGDQKADAMKTDAAKTGTMPAVPRTVEQIVREADGPNLDEIKMDAPPAPTPAGSVIEPSAIYSAAKLPTAPFSAEQMLDMLASLPKELPLETRRQTVNVTFGALGKGMGATPESVVADASRKMAALAAYEEYLKKRTEEFAKTGEAEIEVLQAQIEEKRRALYGARTQLQSTSQMCHSESERLHAVLEFFSLENTTSQSENEKDSSK